MQVGAAIYISISLNGSSIPSQSPRTRLYVESMFYGQAARPCNVKVRSGS